MAALISVDQFRAELRANRVPTGGVFRVSVEPPVPVDGAERTLRFCYSDESVDRMGDTIKAAGWDLTDYVRNPVALWAHDSFSPPIGGGRNVGIEAARLMGDIEFAPAETYPFADTIYRLLLGKFLRAVSVGFLPTKHVFVQNDPDRPWGIDFIEQSLLEISVCPVPANPNALAEARRKGIDTRPLVEWAERVLDGGGAELKRVLITRDELQRLRTAAKENSMSGKPRIAGQTRRVPVRRDDGGATEDDPTAGGATVGNCGRGPDQECGMKDPDECSVHGGAAALDPDDAKLLSGLRRLIGGRKDGAGDDDPPVAHEDAIRLAHKSIRTAKAFQTESAAHVTKAEGLLRSVVEAIDGADPITDPPPDTDPDPATKAAQLARAAALAAKAKPGQT